MATLYVICGPAGAGKSTYGKKLSLKKKACLLDSDTVTEPVVRAGMAFGGEDPDDRDSPVYRSAFREPVYECLYRVAEENLRHLDVVLVGPFTSEIRNKDWKQRLEERFNIEVRVIFITCSVGERKRRIEQRGNPRDDLKLRDWDGFLASSDSRPPAFEHILIES